MSGSQRLPNRDRAELQRLLTWALELERDGLATLATTHAVSGECFLRPFLLGETRGAVTIWHNTTMALWATVMEQRSPEALERLRSHFARRLFPRASSAGVEDDVLSILSCGLCRGSCRRPRAPASLPHPL